MRPAGLHVHLGSQIRDVDTYVEAAAWLAEFIDRTRPGRPAGARPRRRPCHRLHRRRPRPRRARRRRGDRDRARRPPGRTRPAAAGADPRAGPLDRRPGRSDALHRRRDQAHGGRASPTRPSTAGMADNPRPAMYGARYQAFAVDRAGEEADPHLRDRRQALRVGRRPDRGGAAAGAASRRRAGAGRDRGVHGHDGIDLQRPAAAGGGDGRPTAASASLSPARPWPTCSRESGARSRPEGRRAWPWRWPSHHRTGRRADSPSRAAAPDRRASR